jgi:alkylation response protein AidB-like acyl-CoA dehydrogenase
MPVERLLPTEDARDLLALTVEIADKELGTRVEAHERSELYPEGLFGTLADAGLLGLAYPEEWGGGAQPYEVYLQVLEEFAARWAAVAVAVSVHTLATHPLAAFGTEKQ